MKGCEILQAKIHTWAEQKSEQICIIETNSGRQITYQEFFHAVIDMLAYLGKESKTIMVMLNGGIVDSILWTSCLIGGHLIIPLSPHLSRDEYKQAIKKHDPDLVISETDYTILSEKIVTIADCQKIVEEGIQKRKTFPSDLIPRDGSVFLSTSGSTGKPKGMILSTTQIVITADNIRKSHQITDKDRGLTPLPFYHVNAPIVSLITSLLAGSTLIIAPKYSTSHFWEWVEKYDPTWISLVPTMITMLLTTDKPDFLQRSSLRFIRTASAPLPVITLKRFEKKFGIPLVETYGISEAASTITANPISSGKRKPGSVGLPLEISLEVFNPTTHQISPPGEVGEICIKGPNVITSYEEYAGQDAFFQGWFRTGDLGYKDNEGYVYLTGRSKDIIIRGGENISPREIEEVLMTFSAVSEVVVVGHPDPIYGEKVVAFVVTNKKENDNFSDKLQTYARKKLSPQKVPAEIHMLDILPRTHTGKVDKNALRKWPIHS